jgi:hypothetical protein
VWQWIGLVVAVLSFVAVVVIGAVGGPAALVLAPLVAGIAVLVVASSRLTDLAARTAASIRDDAAVWRRSELPARARAAFPDLDGPDAVAAWEASAWGVAVAHPFTTEPTDATVPTDLTVPTDPRPRAALAPASLRRANHAAFGLTAGAAAFLLVVGASAAVAPVVRALQDGAGSTLALGLQDDGTGTGTGDPSGPTAPATPDGSEDAPWTSDDGTITASFITDDDTWQATCGTVDFADADSCSAWQFAGECDGPAKVTIGFSETEGGDDVRTDTRTVSLRSDEPLVLVETSTEEWSSIQDATCSAPVKSPVAMTRTPLDSDDADADGSWPDGCVDFGCAGWELTPDADCPSASVQFSVWEETGDLPAPHQVVVPTALHSGDPVDVWAGGAWSSDDDATLVGVTCG